MTKLKGVTDNNTCEHCLRERGKAVDSMLLHQSLCTNENGCRCYLGRDITPSKGGRFTPLNMRVTVDELAKFLRLKGKRSFADFIVELMRVYELHTEGFLSQKDNEDLGDFSTGYVEFRDGKLVSVSKETKNDN